MGLRIDRYKGLEIYIGGVVDFNRSLVTFNRLAVADQCFIDYSRLRVILIDF